MKRDHEGDIKGFTHLSRAWYGKANLPGRNYEDEVIFGFYAPEGGTSGEMGMRWVALTPPTATPQLQVFCDGWSALGHFKDVIDRLAEVDSQDITPSQFCQILTECGFTDQTPEEDPYGGSVKDANERREYERLRAKFGR